jgi:hypothetical protein
VLAWSDLRLLDEDDLRGRECAVATQISSAASGMICSIG